MRFGFTLKPDHTIERTLALTRQAEAAGFEYAWMFDSHVLWQEVYVLLTLMATASERLRLGTCVTNPATREPTVTASALATLNQISGGLGRCNTPAARRPGVHSPGRPARSRGRQMRRHPAGHSLVPARNPAGSAPSKYPYTPDRPACR